MGERGEGPTGLVGWVLHQPRQMDKMKTDGSTRRVHTPITQETPVTTDQRLARLEKGLITMRTAAPCAVICTLLFCASVTQAQILEEALHSLSSQHRKYHYV